MHVRNEFGEMWYTRRRLSTRFLQTVFGPVQVVRMGYSRLGSPSLYPRDQTLALPARSFSYQLPRRLVKAAVQNPFHEAVEAQAELTGVSVSKRSLEELLPDAAQDFDAFYRERSPERRPARSWWRRSIARAFLWSSPLPNNLRCDSARVKKPTANAWPRWPPCSPVRLGCVPRNRSWKAYSAPAPLSRIARLPRVRKTSGCGPVCSKTKASGSRK